MSLLDWILLISLLLLVFLIAFKGLGCSSKNDEKSNNQTAQKSIGANLENRLDDIKENIHKNFEYYKNEVSNTLDKLKEKESEGIKLLSEIEILRSEKKEHTHKLLKIEEELMHEKENKLISENEKLELFNKNYKTQEELEKITQEIEPLKTFEKVIKSEKLMILLNTILKNDALEKYRKESGLVDDSANSIKELLLRLSTAHIFVKSYYENLVEYKKENQNVMSHEEIAFYEAINSYFGEEVILNVNQTKIDGKFDKSKHRGINNEKEGEMDNGIVLIPADTTNNDKIKVKMK